MAARNKSVVTDADEVQRVTDYLAGMTDRFCLSQRELLRSGDASGENP